MRLTGTTPPYQPEAPRFGWLSGKQLPLFMDSGVLNYLDRPTLIQMRNYMGTTEAEGSLLRKATPIDEAIAQKPRYPDYFNPFTTPQQQPIRAIANTLAELFKATHYPVPDTLFNALLSEFKALKTLEKS